MAHRRARHPVAVPSLTVSGRRVALLAAALLLVAAAADRIEDAADARGLLAAALGAPPSPDLDRRRAIAVAMRTATCMHARGFAYAAWLEPPPDIPDAGLAPAAWAARWGFGMATGLDRAVTPMPVDPNLERIATDAAGRRREFLDALFGTDGASGCHGTASDAVYGLRERELAPLREPLRRLAEAIQSDARVIEAADRWRACVQAALPSAAGELDLGDPGRPDAVIAWFAEGTNGLAVGSRARARLADAERHVAVALVGCGETWSSARAVASRGHERAFVRRHAAQLAAIGARIRAEEAAYPAELP